MTTIDTWPELGQRIREARLAHGLSQGELAEQLQVDRSALVRIETGDRKVSTLELLRLSEALELPVSHFVHRSPATIVSRRQSLDDSAPALERRRFQLDAWLEVHLRDAEALRHAGTLHPIEDLPDSALDTPEAARELARRTRDFIELPVGPLPAMADVAERVGLYIRVIDAEIDGASLTPERGFGVSVVGGQTPSGRRRFTAAHEIGHHVLGDEYRIDLGVSTSKDDRERLIDRFASELLLPAAELHARWRPVDAWTQLVGIAAEYRVSWASAVRSAQCLDLISKADAVRLHAKVPQLGDFLAILGEAPAEDLTTGTAGPRWSRAVLAAYAGARITKARAVELLSGAIREDELPSVDEAEP